jgi:hypothetical protein
LLDGRKRTEWNTPFNIEPSRRIPLLGQYEDDVDGGGPAGIATAIAAGRRGRSTILIERYGFMGGAGTAAGLSTFCGLHAVVHDRVQPAERAQAGGCPGPAAETVAFDADRRSPRPPSGHRGRDTRRSAPDHDDLILAIDGRLAAGF